MNKDEWTSLVTVIVALAAPQALKYGVSTSDLTNALMGAFSVAMVGWTIWHNWNMRKIPERGVVTAIASTPSEAKAQSIPVAK
jgi:hypothetical protein